MPSIKAIAMDVDGVLTDGCVWLDGEGRETKRLAFVDIMGVSLGRKAGLGFALISGEGGPLLDQVATKLGIADVYAGCRDKASALRDFAERHGHRRDFQPAHLLHIEVGVGFLAQGQADECRR